MDALARHYQTVMDFKTTQMAKKKEIENEEDRYKLLLRQFTEVKKQGEEDQKRLLLKHLFQKG